jgi:ribosome-binding factor A
MAANRRLPMVARELLREIATIVNFGMQDPRMKMVTITKVDPAPDLKSAKVYFSLLGDENERALTLRTLQDARNWIRGELRRNVKSLRYIPELTFKFDASIAGSVRISKLIDQVAKESKERAEHGAEAPGEGTDEGAEGGRAEA